MGNKVSRKKVAVDERYTRPQGLYDHADVDLRRLKKLILEGRLAPCCAGVEEGGESLEDCPICFLGYPYLNRSKCCGKGICTECFLQLRPPPSSRTVPCPFCKTSAFSVEFRGEKTAEEKGAEQEEEQKVAAARIRMQEEERRADKARQQRMQVDPEYQRQLQHELLQQQFTLRPPEQRGPEAQEQERRQGEQDELPVSTEGPGSSREGTAASRASERATAHSSSSRTSNTTQRGSGGAHGGGSGGVGTFKSVRSFKSANSTAGGVQPLQLLLPGCLAAIDASSSSAAARGAQQAASAAAAAAAAARALDDFQLSSAAAANALEDLQISSLLLQQQQQQQRQPHNRQDRLDSLAAAAAAEQLLSLSLFAEEGALDGGANRDRGRGRDLPYPLLNLTPEFSPEFGSAQQTWSSRPGAETGQGAGSVASSSSGGLTPNNSRGGSLRDPPAEGESALASPPLPLAPFSSSRYNLIAPRFPPHAAASADTTPFRDISSSPASDNRTDGSASSGRGASGVPQTVLFRHHHQHQHVHQHIHEHVYDFPDGSGRNGLAAADHRGALSRAGPPLLPEAAADETAGGNRARLGPQHWRAQYMRMLQSGDEMDGVDLEDLLVTEAILASLQDQQNAAGRANGEQAALEAVPASSAADGSPSSNPTEPGVTPSPQSQSSGLTLTLRLHESAASSAAGRGFSTRSSEGPSREESSGTLAEGDPALSSRDTNTPQQGAAAEPGSEEDDMLLALAISMLDKTGEGL